MHDGELPADWVDRPAPDPAQFRMSAEDDGSRDNPLFRNGSSCNEYDVDAAALATVGDRLIIAVGAASGDALAARGGRTVAEHLGLPVTVFPSDHAGFSGGEYGRPAGDPEGFAATLLRVLA